MSSDRKTPIVVCQHCGAEAQANRTMCPQCRRRMVPSSARGQTSQSGGTDSASQAIYEAGEVVADLRHPPASQRWEPPPSQFIQDLKSAFTACRRAPGLVLVTIVLTVVTSLISTASSHRSMAWITLPGLVVELFVVGFTGSQRIWLLDAMTGRQFPIRRLWPLTWSYFGRFLRLGLLTAWPAVLIGIPLLVALRRSHGALAFTVFVVVYGLILDVLLTFVVPELTFFTSSARDGWRSGRALIRASWPRSRWYVLTPGLALVALGNSLGRLDKTAWQAGVVGAVSALLALLLKGTILNYYVRIRPQILDNPAPGAQSSTSRLASRQRRLAESD